MNTLSTSPSNSQPTVITLKRYWRQFAGHYIAGIACLLGTNILSVSVPGQIQAVLKLVSHAPSNVVMGQALAWVVATLVAMFFIRVTSRYFLIGVGRLVEFDLREMLFAHLLKLDQHFFETNSAGALMSRLSNDLGAFRIFMGGAMMLLFNALFAFILVPFNMWKISPQLTIVAFLIYPIILVFALTQSRKLKALTITAQTQLAKLSGLAQETFFGINVIQSYGKHHVEARRFGDLSDTYRETNLKVVALRVLVSLVVSLITSVSIALILTQGGLLVMDKVLDVADLTAMMLYMERLAWPTITIGWILSSLQQGQAAKQRINELFAEQPLQVDVAIDERITQLELSDIKLVDLNFAYPNRPEQLVLNDINLVLPAKKTIAIVGPLGCGKSTLLKLLAKRYPVQQHQLYYGHYDYAHISTAVLNQSVSLMTQEDYLFSDTIERNLRLNQTIETETLDNALMGTTLDVDIAGFEKGLHTVVGDRGVLLSGGQRQRTALTRSLLKQADVLLLDDPFSNVDIDTEQKILTGLRERQLLKNKTTVIVTHRFSVVQSADVVVVMNEQGKIEATGKHVELMQRSPFYQLLLQHDTTLEKLCAVSSDALEGVDHAVG